jgi:serine/tyrosine/threonine adenylyltransferase
VSHAQSPTLNLDHRFARDLPELAVAWQAEEAPEPRLLALNEPLARTWGSTRPGCAAAGDRAADRHRGAGGRDAGRAGLRRPPVRRLLAPAGRRPGAAARRAGRLLRSQLRDLHLKGSGRTPFSRGGDGLAAVGPMLREYVISEAMHALGIPTTRSLGVVATGRDVHRETAAARRRAGPGRLQPPAGRQLPVRRAPPATSTCCAAWPTTPSRATTRPPQPAEQSAYLALLRAVVDAQARLVARWMLVGFVHGVMNTDNMTISGESIDYGPCAFLDAVRPRHGLQLDRHRRPLRLRATSPRPRSGTSPGSPRPCCRSSTTTRSERRRGGDRLARDASRRHYADAFTDGHATKLGPARRTRATPWWPRSSRTCWR